MVIIYHLTQHCVTEDLNLHALNTWLNLKVCGGNQSQPAREAARIRKCCQNIYLADQDLDPELHKKQQQC
jgi:hypothetical protein